MPVIDITKKDMYMCVVAFFSLCQTAAVPSHFLFHLLCPTIAMPMQRQNSNNDVSVR